MIRFSSNLNDSMRFVIIQTTQRGFNNTLSEIRRYSNPNDFTRVILIDNLK